MGLLTIHLRAVPKFSGNWWLKPAYHNPVIIVRHTSVHIIEISLQAWINAIALRPGPTKLSALSDVRVVREKNHAITEEAAAMTNQSISQFMVSTASERAAEVIDQHRRLLLNEKSWNLVMDAITNPPVPNDRLKHAAKRLQELE